MTTKLIGPLAMALLVAAPVTAQQGTSLDSTLLASVRWRSIGPANMGGRITDIEGIGSPSKTWFVAAAAGGIWKTTNNGTTFRPVFDDQRVISMGDLAIAPSDTLQVWAGTGEEDSRNSISPGGGIFKSSDGGLTWAAMGLEKTGAIGRIVVHPRNPDVVWVAALGQIWAENPERGLYKTTDGGATWRLVKFISERAGFVDVVIDPRDPDVLFASSWERIRGPYFLQSGGPGSALWKSADGGATWTEVSGGGFPTTTKGRIGLAIAPSNPEIIYALVEAEKEADGSLGSGLYRSEDGGATWALMNSNNVRPFYYSQVRVDPANPDRVYWSSTPVNFSDDGGRTVRQATLGLHVDHHAMWIDPHDPDHLVIGNDGGIAQSWDRGGNYDFINTIPLGQFYEVSYNMAVPYRVCGGLQDNGSWCGPSRKARGAITNHDWFTYNGGDGFVTAQDPTDPNRIYGESQGGNMVRYDLASGEATRLEKPDWRPGYRAVMDSILELRGDTTQPVSAAVQARIDALRARASADSAALELRWNWNTPFLISPHDPTVFYAGANRVLKSTARGDGLVPISPDLSWADTMKIRVSTRTTGGVTPDVTGAETFATVVALAESPLRRGMLLAGTDDGRVWITRDDGGRWDELTTRFRGVPEGAYVRRFEASRHDADRFYVAFDDHRRNDFRPYVFVTEDGGRSFRSIASDLPADGPGDFVHVVREDPVNENLLFVGTDVAVYASLDRGASWRKFMNGLPTTPVHDLQIHPRDRELIAGTHGRSIWIVDIAPLQQRPVIAAADGVALLDPRPAFQFGEPPVGGESTGQQYFEARSPDAGAEIAYWVGEAGSAAKVVIRDADGDTIQVLDGPARAGLHRVSWNFRPRPAPPAPLSPSERADSARTAAKLRAIGDSMVEAGAAQRPVMDRLIAMIESGDRSAFGRMFGGGGGGARSETGEFVERPAESPVPAARGQGRAGPAGARAGGEAREGAAPDFAAMGDVMREMFGVLRNAGINLFGGGGRRGQQQPAVEPGDYEVTLIVGDRSVSKTLKVERVNGSGGGSGFQELDD